MSAARFGKCQGRSLLAGLLASRPGIPGGICVYCTRSRRVQGTEVFSKLRLGQTVVTPLDLGGALMESHPRATSLSPRLCCSVSLPRQALGRPSSLISLSPPPRLASRPGGVSLALRPRVPASPRPFSRPARPRPRPHRRASPRLRPPRAAVVAGERRPRPGGGAGPRGRRRALSSVSPSPEARGAARPPLGAFKAAGGSGEAAAAAAEARGAGARGAACGVRSGPEAARLPGPGRERRGARAAQPEPAARDMAQAGRAGEGGRREGRAGGRGEGPARREEGPRAQVSPRAGGRRFREGRAPRVLPAPRHLEERRRRGWGRVCGARVRVRPPPPPPRPPRPPARAAQGAGTSGAVRWPPLHPTPPAPARTRPPVLPLALNRTRRCPRPQLSQETQIPSWEGGVLALHHWGPSYPFPPPDPGGRASGAEGGV